MKHIVALSGGKDSTAMALRLAEVEPRDYEYVCTPTGWELPEMFDHWANIGDMLGKEILQIRSQLSFDALIILTRSLPSWRMRWCTGLLKIEPFERHLLANLPCTAYVGIRADETDGREGVAWEHIGFPLLGLEVVRDYPLVRWGWGLQRVLGYLQERQVNIPARTDCDGCFFQMLYEWYLFWKNYPDRYAKREAQEEYTGHTLRSPGRDTWPASLKGLRERFEAGDIPKQRQSMKDRKVMCSTCAR